MKTLLSAAAALLLAGCALPVVNTELPTGWKSVQRYGTGTHMAPTYDTAVKYMAREDVADMQRDRTGSKEGQPR